uniref:Uncharacterized protein n=1 Tax=Cacopsylla melanoneura TaxID=428564 RepID=A0A8D8WXN0_9HEMI
MKWQIGISWTGNSEEKYLYTLFLICTSKYDLTCTVECQLSWISKTDDYDSMVLPYKSLHFNCRDGIPEILKIGQYELNCNGGKCELKNLPLSWYKAFAPNKERSFELDMKSVRIIKKL